MDKFNFDQLMNIQVPESCIEKALNVPAEHKRPVLSVKFYRIAAAAAACIVIAAAATFSLIFGSNQKVELTKPDPKPEFIAEPTVPDTTGSVTAPSQISESKAYEADQTASVTEPRETGADSSDRQTPAASNGDNASQTPEETVAKTEAHTDAPEKDYTAGKPDQSETQPVTAEPEPTKPTRPNDPEVYGCHFLTTVEMQEAEGKSYYCSIKDESGDLLGCGTAQKYDWGNPDWPLDLKYTADYALQYGNNYTVTFYDSNGENVWDGTVYLQQNKSSYLLYNE